MEFSRPEYWSGEPFPSPGDLPNSGIKPRSPALQEDSLPGEPQGKPIIDKIILKIHMEIKESRMVMILLNFFLKDLYTILWLCKWLSGKESAC